MKRVIISLLLVCMLLVASVIPASAAEKTKKLQFDKDGELPPMVVSKDGSTIYIVGKVDRVDFYNCDGNTYIRIIDYKLGSMEIDFSKIYNGLQLQLLTYLEAVMESLDKKGEKAVPCGVFYYKMDDPIIEDKEHLTKEEIEEAYTLVDPELVDVIRKALVNIREYHEKQRQYSWFDSKPNGTMLGQKVTPLATTGVYVPGGKAVYPSSVLMNVIPAKVAGVGKIVMVTPPGKDGKVNPNTLVAAKEAGADEAVLYVSIATNFNNYKDIDGDEEARAKDYLRKAEKKAYQQAKAEHVAFFKQYMDRVSLHLGDDKYADVTTDMRVQNFKDTHDDFLVATYFRFGRYLLICSSQPGGQPANLQGIWNDKLTPSWDSKYTCNINVEMNYWPAPVCNLPEMVEPLVRMNQELLVNGRKTAQQFFGCEGSACFHNTDLWRKTSPANGRSTWAFWPFGAAWMCRNLFDTYLFTEDEDYLKQILPVLKENALFCEQIMRKTKYGYAPTPATSPENLFVWNGEDVPVALFTEDTLAICRNLNNEALSVTGILPTGIPYSSSQSTSSLS